MKKIASILFLAVYMLSATPAKELLKLPMMFKHFAEHKAEKQSIGFLEFLDIHYFQGNPKDDDYQEDMKLPFKESANLAFSPTHTFVPIFSTYTEGVYLKPSPSSRKVSIISQDDYFPSPYLSNIWQPPKSC